MSRAGSETGSSTKACDPAPFFFCHILVCFGGFHVQRPSVSTFLQRPRRSQGGHRSPRSSLVRRPFSAAPAGSQSRLQGDIQLYKRRSTVRRFPSHIRGLPGVKLDRFIAFVSDLPYQENETL